MSAGDPASFVVHSAQEQTLLAYPEKIWFRCLHQSHLKARLMKALGWTWQVYSRSGVQAYLIPTSDAGTSEKSRGGQRRPPKPIVNDMSYFFGPLGGA